MAHRTFAVIGATVSGNHGAEAMLSVAIQRVRERHPDARFVVLSYYPREDAALVRDPGVVIADARPAALALGHFPFALLVGAARALGFPWPRALLPTGLALLRDSHALLDAQGISFDDGRTLVLPYKVLSILPAMLMGVPVVKLSQAMGPFRNPLNRAAAGFLLGRCAHSFARGRITADGLRRLGLPGDRWSVAADLAFAYEPGDALSSIGQERAEAIARELQERRAAGTLVVSCSPSSVVQGRMARQGRDYLALMTRLLAAASTEGRHVVVVPNATRASRSTRNNDLPVIAALRQRVRSELGAEQQARITWVDFDLSFEGIRLVLGATEALIASRFHAMVAALGLGVPVLVIGWSHKYAEVLEDFGCAEYALDHSAPADRAEALLAELLSRRAELAGRIRQALPAVVASARGQFAVEALR